MSNSPGLVQCDCVSGYYRAVIGEEDLPCVCELRLQDSVNG